MENIGIRFVSSMVNKNRDVNISDNNADTLTHLKIIGRAAKGKKLNTKNLTFYGSSLWDRIIRSTINNDNRANLLTFIKNTISRVFEIIRLYNYSDKLGDKIKSTSLIIDLVQAVEGINNMKVTYSEDECMVGHFDVIILDINTGLAELKQTNPDIFPPDHIESAKQESKEEKKTKK